MPRSASSSSTSRYDNAKRSYQRTANTITSDGKQKPAKADRGIGARRRWRVLMAVVCLLSARSQQMQQSRRLLHVAVGEAEAQVPADGEDDDIGWEAEPGEGGLIGGGRARWGQGGCDKRS